MARSTSIRPAAFGRGRVVHGPGVSARRLPGAEPPAPSSETSHLSVGRERHERTDAQRGAADGSSWPACLCILAVLAVVLTPWPLAWAENLFLALGWLP